MNRRIMYGIGGGIILSLVGAMIGLFVGMNIGGNYFSSFEWMGNHGYEAVGYLGAIIGAVIGLIFGAWLGMNRSGKMSR